MSQEPRRRLDRGNTEDWDAYIPGPSCSPSFWAGCRHQYHALAVSMVLVVTSRGCEAAGADASPRDHR